MTSEIVETVAEALHESLTMLGAQPDEVPEHGGPSTGETLAATAVAAVSKLASNRLESALADHFGWGMLNATASSTTDFVTDWLAVNS